jgi:hypothetical protein
VIGVGERVDAMRRETAASFDEIRRGALSAVTQVLTPRVEGLEYRVKILEGKAERENRDVLEVIRERFGLPPAQ